MKTMLSFVVTAMVLAGFSTLAQQPGESVKSTPAVDAKKMIGTNAVVVGKVADVHKSTKAIQLNFGDKFPDQDFTAVVFAKNFTLFTNLESLTGKTVEVSGKVVEYKGKPEIILTNKGQLKVLQADKESPVERP